VLITEFEIPFNSQFQLSFAPMGASLELFLGEIEAISSHVIIFLTKIL